MAETNSNIYAGQIASPPTKFDVGELGGRKRIIAGTATVTSTDFDADGDVVRLCQLPSNARVLSIKLNNDDLGSGEDSVNVGIYAAEGALIDEDEFATAVVQFDGLEPIYLEVFGAGLASVAVVNAGLTMWERAGLSSDTGLKYDIALTQTATVVTPITGAIGFIVEYTVD